MAAIPANRFSLTSKIVLGSDFPMSFTCRNSFALRLCRFIRTCRLWCIITILAANCLTRTTYAELPYVAAWTRQFGTSAYDAVNAIVVDSASRVYVVGRTDGLLGTTNSGAGDAFVRSFDSQGTLRWTQQFGTSALDEAQGAVIDGAGNVIVSGTTKGNLMGTNLGDQDGFLRKFDANGNAQWTKQFGTTALEDVRGVTVDPSNNVYVSGLTNGNLTGTNQGFADAFVQKYTSAGVFVWTSQVGTSRDDAFRAAIGDGAGNVIVAGSTRDVLGAASSGLNDVIVTKYDNVHSTFSTNQFGTATDDFAFGLSRDASGNLYVTGRYNAIEDSTTNPNFDAYLTKLNSSGTVLWTKPIATSAFEVGLSSAVDSHGNVYVAGATRGNLVGTNHGDFDAFLSKFDTNGTLLWQKQLGTSPFDSAMGLAIDKSDNLYLAGRTEGSLFSTNLGASDAYVMKLIPQLPGDYNHNGIVDAADYTVWRDSLGRSGAELAADGNNNGTIDAGDYDVWKMHFGAHTGSGADSGNSVPEPGTRMLLLAGILCLSKSCRLWVLGNGGYGI
jgi:hypothetical protein